MKFINYEYLNRRYVGIVEGENVYDVSHIYPNMIDAIKTFHETKDQLNEVINNNKSLKLQDVKLLSPILNPLRNIMCIGWNYLKHFEERHQKDIELPEHPTVFTKATKTIANPYDEIEIVDHFTEKLDYEAELAVIIGKDGRNISEEEAFDYIFGYTCANDLTARDVQHKHGGQWFLGKSMDNSCPLGPWIITKDEIEDVQYLDIMCKVNGQVVQSSNTSLMIFPIARIIAELSKGMTLLTGDIILTGTPSGIGFKRNPPILLKDGDEVEVTISKIGTIKNKIKKSSEVALSK